MIITKTIIFAAVILALAIGMIAQGLRKKSMRVVDTSPHWQNAELVGDGAVQNWSRSARISEMHKQGMGF